MMYASSRQHLAITPPMPSVALAAAVALGCCCCAGAAASMPSAFVLPPRPVPVPSLALLPRGSSPRFAPSPSWELRSMSDDDYPSDYDKEDLTTAKKVEVDTNDDDATIREALKREILLLGGVTNRGEAASVEEKDIVIDLVAQLEALNPTADPALNCQGEWELVLSSTQFFRSSPFFMAIRSAVGEENKQIALNFFSIHDRATSASRVGHVRQSISKDELVSEVDLTVGLTPGFPVRVKGTVVTTAQLRTQAPETWEVTVEGTKVTGSNVPFLDQFLDDYPLVLPVDSVYAQILGKVPVSELKTFYVDEDMRITRDSDDNYFVFART